MYRIILMVGISLSCGLYFLVSMSGQASANEYPSAEISNELIKMKLFLPDHIAFFTKLRDCILMKAFLLLI